MPRWLTLSVLQDAVNRRIAMKMMVDTAAQADQTQFILITPQDMGVRASSLRVREDAPLTPLLFPAPQSLSSFGDEVKIVKLADPSRASGTRSALLADELTLEKSSRFLCLQARSLAVAEETSRPASAFRFPRAVCAVVLSPVASISPSQRDPYAFCLPSFPVSMFLCIYCAGPPSIVLMKFSHAYASPPSAPGRQPRAFSVV